MPTEVELKLTLNADDAAALAASGLIGGEVRPVHQRAIYFDTPACDLRKAGLSLRIRQADGVRIQTVKARGTGSAGLFSRSEWERPVADDSPALDDVTPIRALLGERAAELAPVFAVSVARRIWNVVEADAIVELALDVGEVVAGDRRSGLCEIELELKRGDPAALFRLARRLDAAAPLRLGVLTKADRGYALRGPLATAFGAEPIDLSRDMTAAQAFQEIVGACLRQFRRNEDLLLAGHSAPALHQARVALRRMRTSFSIFKPLLDDDETMPGLRDELRWLAAELGEARGIDALLDHSPAGAIRDRLTVARETSQAGVDAVLASPRARLLVLNVAQCSASGAWLADVRKTEIRDQPVRAFASAALDRLYRRVKKHGRDLAGIDDRARHEVRKEAKKLRYAAAFFTALFDHKRTRRRHKRFLVALEGMQDGLGTLNDLATAPHLLTMLGLDDAPGAVARLFPGDRKELLRDAEKAYARMAKAPRFWR